jgi:hypothetical protein
MSIPLRSDDAGSAGAARQAGTIPEKALRTVQTRQYLRQMNPTQEIKRPKNLRFPMPQRKTIPRTSRKNLKNFKNFKKQMYPRYRPRLKNVKNQIDPR